MVVVKEYLLLGIALVPCPIYSVVKIRVGYFLGGESFKIRITNVSFGDIVA